MNCVKYKELLTFSNLANLDWHFVNFPDNKDDIAGQTEESFKLNDILTNPKSFAETDENGDIKAYCYGADDDENFINKDQGLKEMRREAGMAMEYMEHINGEGSFLKNWEVIYGGDNYKVLEDFYN